MLLTIVKSNERTRAGLSDALVARSVRVTPPFGKAATERAIKLSNALFRYLPALTLYECMCVCAPSELL